MIRQITVGKRYLFRGHVVTVITKETGPRGWRPDMVTVRRLDDGSETKHLARHFRDEADLV